MRTVFEVRTRGTAGDAEGTEWTDLLARDWSDYGCPEETAMAAAVALHAIDGVGAPALPIVLSVRWVADVGLPGYGVDAGSFTASDVDGSTGGIGGESMFTVETLRPTGNVVRGVVVTKARMRDSGAADWSSVTEYYLGSAVKYGGHNYLGLSWPGGVSNTNKQPDTHPEYWLLDDVSAAEYAVQLAIVAATDPAYAGGATYAEGDLAVDSGITYRSLAAANTGHTPVSSPLWWLAIGKVVGRGATLTALTL